MVTVVVVVRCSECDLSNDRGGDDLRLITSYVFDRVWLSAISVGKGIGRVELSNCLVDCVDSIYVEFVCRNGVGGLFMGRV